MTLQELNQLADWKATGHATVRGHDLCISGNVIATQEQPRTTDAGKEDQAVLKLMAYYYNNFTRMLEMLKTLAAFSAYTGDHIPVKTASQVFAQAHALVAELEELK